MFRYVFVVTPHDPKTVEVAAADYEDAYDIVLDWCQLKGNETNLYWKILDGYGIGTLDEGEADYKASDLIKETS